MGGGVKIRIPRPILENNSVFESSSQSYVSCDNALPAFLVFFSKIKKNYDFSKCRILQFFEKSAFFL